MAGSLDWQLWSNETGACITTYGDNPAFSATWDETGSGADLLARAGLVWQKPAAYTTFGTITAEFAETKTGTGGGFSYVGIYGWSLPPTAGSSDGCVEFYIVDDSFNTMPVNPGGTTKMGTATIDGGEYILYTRTTPGTGGNNCNLPSGQTWTQFYSVRETARSCGQISITDHFNAWAMAGMNLGNLQEAQLLVETGGGDGNIDFTTASVTATQ